MVSLYGLEGLGFGVAGVGPKLWAVGLSLYPIAT